MENWAVGWVDWNLALDKTGGPNHVKNNVDSPIIVDQDSKDRYWKQPMYYHLAHFSRFIPPGSMRVQVHSHYSIIKRLYATVWRTPENYLVAVVLNTNSLSDVTYRINIPGQGYVERNIEKKAIDTVIVKL